MVFDSRNRRRPTMLNSFEDLPLYSSLSCVCLSSSFSLSLFLIMPLFIPWGEETLHIMLLIILIILPACMTPVDDSLGSRSHPSKSLTQTSPNNNTANIQYAERQQSGPNLHKSAIRTARAPGNPPILLGASHRRPRRSSDLQPPKSTSRALQISQLPQAPQETLQRLNPPALHTPQPLTPAPNSPTSIKAT